MPNRKIGCDFMNMIRTNITLYERVDYNDTYSTIGFHNKEIFLILQNINSIRGYVGIDIDRGRFPFRVRMI